MSSTIRFALAGLALLATTGASAPVAGPPWISIEYPANPHDASTRDAFLLVHAFHHGTAMNFPVSGTAEGLYDGQRRTVTLRFTPTSRPGVYALRKQWDDRGIWSLVITVSQGEHEQAGIAQALVEIGRDGGVASVKVPTGPNREGFRIPRRVTSQEIEQSLRARAAD